MIKISVKNFVNILKDNKNEDYYRNVAVLGMMITAFVHIIFLILFIYLEVKELIIINIFSILIYAYAILIADMKNEIILSWIVYIEIIAHGLLATYYIGYESGFHYYIYNLVFIPYYAHVGAYQVKIFRMSFLIIVSLSLFTYFPNITPIVKLDQNILELLNMFNIFGFLFLGTLVTYIFNMKLETYVKELALQSSTDSLTGLYNRRYFLKAAQIEIQNDIRHKNNTAVLMLDIDFFKKVNDTYGHDCGDYVINRISSLIKQNVRPVDVVARWGGEEYLILMPSTNKIELEVIAQRIRKNVEESLMEWGDMNLYKTVSLGGAILNGSEEIMDFVARADSALYTSKNSGRNCYNFAA